MVPGVCPGRGRSTILSSPSIGLALRVDLWTEANFGFGARTIAFVDTTVTSPFAELSMIPALTLVAINAPAGRRATWFALMASLMNLALMTLDRAEAKPLWDRYAEIIHQDQPYTFLYYLVERVGVNNRLRGVEADARGHLISAAEWWIPEQYRTGEQPVAMAGDPGR